MHKIHILDITNSLNLSRQVKWQKEVLNEAALYLGLTQWGVRTLIWQGVIPVVKPGRRKIHLDIKDLESFIKKNKFIYQ